MLYRTCANHRGVRTKRKCYQCGRPICRACTLRASHHFFCGRWCHGRYLLTALPRKAARASHRRMQRVFRFWGQHFSWRIPAEIIVVTVLVAANVLLLRRVHQLEDQVARLTLAYAGREDRPARAQRREPADAVPEFTGFNVVSPVDGARMNSRRIRIIGEAPEKTVLRLYRKGKELQKTTVKNGLFNFQNVRLTNGINTFSIRAADPMTHSAVLETISVRYNDPDVARRSRNFTRGPENAKVVALTFDGGAQDNAVDPILKILAQYNIHATMFLTGRFIKAFPGAARKIVEAGHEVGNHTWNHPHLTTFARNRRHETLPEINESLLQSQLRKTAALFERVTGTSMRKYWRAPYGEVNAEIREWAAEFGYRHIGWTSGRTHRESLDTMDWVADSLSAAFYSSTEILDNLLRISDEDSLRGLSGGIILMHLGTLRTRDPVYRILPALIDELTLRGYSFVTISQLLNEKTGPGAVTHASTSRATH